MQHLVKRTGSRIRQRLGIILAMAALVVAIVFLLRPNRLFGRPDLQLVALDANGLFSDSVDQNAIMPMSEIGKIFQKSTPQPSLPGASRSANG